MLSDLIKQEDRYHLILSSMVLKSKVYTDFYKTRAQIGDVVILDNDAYEGGASAAIETLDTAINLVRPTVVVLPDDMNGDCATNFQMARAGVKALSHWKLPFMGVPHGKTIREYFDCARLLVGLGVASLGIYKNLERDLSVQRTSVVQGLGNEAVAIHLLGVTDRLSELSDPYMRWRCSGVDTCRFVQEGLRWHTISGRDDDPAYEGRRADFFEMPEPPLAQKPVTYQVTRTNMDYWRRKVE